MILIPGKGWRFPGSSTRVGAPLAFVLLAGMPCAATGGEDTGAEIVVICDNSGSMTSADPGRLAVLGAMIIDTLGQNPADDVTVIGFGDTATATPPTTRTRPDLRTWGYAGGTYFRKPLQEALGILQRSSHPNKILIFFTDGRPEDVHGPTDLRSVFDPDAHPGIDVLALGLFEEDSRAGREGEEMLRAIVHDPSDFQRVDGAGEVVTSFTRGYARAIGSQAETGILAPGGEHRIGVGRYVSELTVIVLAEDSGGLSRAALSGPSGDVPLLGEGDNGCGGGGLGRLADADPCDQPPRHYQVFQAINESHGSGEWVLSLPATAGRVNYGVILRFGLTVDLRVESSAPPGQPVLIEAGLESGGQTLDDPSFLAQDGFEAFAEVDGVRIPLAHTGGGQFSASWTPTLAELDRDVDVRVVFENDWMRKMASATVAVNVPLALVAPDALDFGEVRAGTATLADDHCQTLDLSASERLEAHEFRLEFVAPGGGCLAAPVREREAGAADRLPLDRVRLAPTERVCLEVPPCAGETAPAGAMLLIVPVDPELADRRAEVALTWTVLRRSWLACHAWWLAIVAGAAASLWSAYGFIRPARFPAEVAICIAGDVAGLKRVTARPLVDVRGSSVGFYRDARLGLTADGELRGKNPGALCCLRARRDAGLVLEGGGIEMRNRRTRRWSVPDDLADGHMPSASTVYRVGGTYFRLEGL